MAFVSYESILICMINNYDLNKKDLRKLAIKLSRSAEPHAINGLLKEMADSDPHHALDVALKRMEHMFEIMSKFSSEGYQGLVKLGDDLYPFNVMIEDGIDDNDPNIQESVMAIQAAHRVMNQLDTRTLPPTCVVFFATQGFSGETHYIPSIVRQRRQMPWDRSVEGSPYVY